MTHSDSVIQRNRIRYLIISLVVIGSLIISVRLIYLQLFKFGYYSSLASRSQTRKYEIPATRGQLYLLSGANPVPIVLNQTLYIVWVDPSEVKDRQAVATNLTTILGGNYSDYLSMISKNNKYVEVAKRVSTDNAKKIMSARLHGVGVNKRDYRTYPDGSLASQVLGFVNDDGSGQYGFEGFMNKSLVGEPGFFAAKTDTLGDPISTSNNIAQQPVDGKSYVLSIDQNIQAEAERQLAATIKSDGAKDGSIVIMNPNNGAIVAMANYPTYDPSNYQSVKDYSLFKNITVNDNYEPGSTMKVLTMATGLDNKAVTPSMTYNDPGFYTIDGLKISNSEGDIAGPNKTMTVVLRDSLNTGAMFVLRMLSGNPNSFNLQGKQILYNYLTQHFGLGSLAGIEQSGESKGYVNTPSNNNGNDVTYADTTFGQAIDVTMLQMVNAMSSIANGGTLYKPTLIAGEYNQDGSITKYKPQIIRKNVISKKAAADLNTMLEVVVQHGTGYIAAAQNPGYAIAGKTGTASIPLPNGQGYLTGATIGSFLGYAPANNPKFVMMVRVNRPVGNALAEYTTVPLFSSMCQWLFKYEAIPPGGVQ